MKCVFLIMSYYKDFLSSFNSDIKFIKNVCVAILLIMTLNQMVAQSTYPLPDVPSSLKQPEERAAFIIEHFWDKADIEKADLEKDGSKLEQSFVDFLSVFPYSTHDVKVKGINNLLSKTRENYGIYFKVIDLAERYLYNEDSPMRDDDTFLIFLDCLVSDPTVDETHKLRPFYLIDSIKKNHPGSQASDFSFETRDGDKTTLYGLESDTDILLMFYDPECEHCEEVINNLSDDKEFVRAVNDNIIKVLAVYSGDNKELWNDTKNSLPSAWIVGYEDGSLQDEEIYIIRSLPSVYLLDRDKTVKIKEMDVKNICRIAK